MGTDTNDAIDEPFDTLLQKFQQAIETSNEKRSKLTHESVVLLYYYFQKIDIRRAESYIKSAEWLAHKEATINPRNENDNKFNATVIGYCQYAITVALNYNKIKKKYLEKIEKIERSNIDFS